MVLEWDVQKAHTGMLVMCLQRYGLIECVKTEVSDNQHHNRGDNACVKMT